MKTQLLCTFAPFNKLDDVVEYTINALNEVIRSLNGGVLDKRFPIPWEEYQNTLLLTNEKGLNKISTKIHKIIDIKKDEK